MENQQSVSVLFSCTLDKIEDRSRRRTMIRRLKESAHQIVELDRGYALQFPYDDSLNKILLKFIALERECCQFLSFELEFAPFKGPVSLRVQGPEGVKAFIQSEVDTGCS
jgi:hypothetical protein